ncbi:MAG: hypothetical protein ACRDAX_03110 [Propionibacteriaceae bacterium]
MKKIQPNLAQEKTMPEPTQPTPTLADLTPEAAQSEPQDSTDWEAKAQQQNRQQAVHMAVMQKAATLGANPNALLNSLRFDRAIAALDPSDPAGIENAIQTEMQADPGLHAAAPARAANRVPRASRDRAQLCLLCHA